MELKIHWQNLKHNFVNQETGLSGKHRLGHKPNQLSQTTTININRKRLDLKFKKEIQKELNKNKHFIRKDMRAVIFISGRRYELSVRDTKTFSNDITNILLNQKILEDNKSLDKLITKNKSITT